LPYEVIKWILYEIPCEPAGYIVAGYIDAIVANGRKFSNPLSMDMLKHLFHRLGAREMALSTASLQPIMTPVIQKLSSRAKMSSIPSNTIYVVRLVKQIALAQPECKTPPANVPEMIHLLASLVMDDSVQGPVSQAALLRQEIREAIGALIVGLPPTLLSQKLEATAVSIFQAVSNPVLRSILLSSLPVSPPAAHRLRRRLALAWTLNSDRWIKDINEAGFDSAASKDEEQRQAKDKIARALTARIEKCLRENPEWAISHHSDFSDGSAADSVALTARIKILDLAIDDGFILPPDAIITATSASKSEEILKLSGAASPQESTSNHHLTTIRSKPGKDPSNNTKQKKEHEEDSHSAHISALTATIRDMSAKIVTSGASHISRLEAKSAIDRLEQRLRHAVRRVKERPRDWYLVGKENDEEGMKRWIGSANPQASSTNT
jgi:hypothetical protein